jgi:hypothetical protein
MIALSASGMPLIQLSQEFLAAVKYNQDVECYLRELKETKPEILLTELRDDDEKKTFWINIYNATVQHALKQDTFQYKKRMAFYGKRRLFVAGHFMSLNDIEHGILRRSQWIYGQGKIKKWFPGKFEKTHRVEQLDIRIHFALNCGAKSCPPILFYSLESLDTQLDDATKGFLVETSSVENETLFLSKLFYYYSGDFGNQKEKIELVSRYTQISNLESIKKIKYSNYDWTLQLDMYR